MELQTNKQTDNPITKCPLENVSGRGHKKTFFHNCYHIKQASYHHGSIYEVKCLILSVINIFTSILCILN